MQKAPQLLLTLWVCLFMPCMAAKSQNILVLQLPDPCSDIGTAVIPIAISNPFQLFVNPNPAKHELTLTVSHTETIGLIKISISDIRGVSVSEEQFFSSHQKWIKTINISHLPQGIYIVSAHRNGQRVSQKIIKQ